MSREFSTYLNVLRLAAALAVVLDHCAWLWTPGHFAPFLAYGRVAPVLVFFVLSGFVIGYSVDHKERTASAYVVNRAARIYSVALPALLATFALDALGRHLAPGLYDAAWGYTTNHMGRQFVRALLFVNEIWGRRSEPGSNGPFWSLAYEVWYYAAFGMIAFGRRRWRLLAAALVLAMAGPWVALLFPVWLLGFGCYRLGTSRSIGRAVGWLLVAGGVVLVVGVEAWATRAGLRAPPEPLFAHRWELGLDYAIGLGIAAHLLGMHAVAPSLAPLLRPVARPIAWAAGATFTLYLFHFPLAQVLVALCPWAPGSWASAAWILGGTLVAVLGIAEVTERRKEPWRRLFAAFLRVLAERYAGRRPAWSGPVLVLSGSAESAVATLPASRSTSVSEMPSARSPSRVRNR